ncbi:MAG: hypothetical protein AAB733_02765 [Patescibacteria group bacterium]
MKYRWLGITLLGSLVLVGAGCSGVTTNVNTNASVNLNLEPLAPQITTGTVNATGEVQGLQVLEEEIALSSTAAGGEATGIARRAWDGKAFQLVVSVSLPDVVEGQTPAVWLASEKPKRRMRLGILTQDADGGWSFTFESKTDYSIYEKMAVTIVQEEEEPKNPVLEGVFDQTLRPIGE